MNAKRIVRGGLLAALTLFSWASGERADAALPVNVAPGQSIQQAIDNANPGDAILIDAGLFHEQITIDKPIRLVGAGTVQTNLSLPTGASGTIVTVTASGTSATDRVEIRGMTILGATGHDASGSGIRFPAAGAGGSFTTIANVKCRQNQGYGVDLETDTSSGAPVTDLKISGCDFSSNGLQGLYQGPNTVVEGLSLTSSHFDLDLEGATLLGRLDGLTIDGCSFDQNQSAGCHVAAYDEGFATPTPGSITHSTFDRNSADGLYVGMGSGPGPSLLDVEANRNGDRGVFLVKTTRIPGQDGRDTTVDTLHLEQVTASEDRHGGIDVWAMIGDLHGLEIADCHADDSLRGIVVRGEAPGTVGPFLYGGNVSGVVHDCVVTGGFWGFQVGDDGEASDPASVPVLLESDEADGSGTGILVYADGQPAAAELHKVVVTGAGLGIDFQTTGGLPLLGIVHRSRIAGNGVGLNGQTSDPVDATCNWWGAPDGPSGLGTGMGDQLVGNVIYSPWLVTDDLDGPCIGGTPYSVKSQALEAWRQWLPSTDAQDDEHIQKAIDHLEKSLDPRYWASSDELTKEGKHVFDEERQALKELDKVKATDVSSAATVLLPVDRTLAETAIAEAEATPAPPPGPGPAAKRAVRVANEIEHAKGELGKGDAEAGSGRPEHAIDHYGKAWEHGEHALEDASKP